MKPRNATRVLLLLSSVLSIEISSGLVSCSSRSSSVALSCDTSQVGDAPHLCTCGAAINGVHANDDECNTSQLGTNAFCPLLSFTGDGTTQPSMQCECFGFYCISASGSVSCGYNLGAFGSPVPESQCVGAHYCANNAYCSCQSTACDATLNETELTSCTDAAAAQMLQQSYLATSASSTTSAKSVSDCRVALGGSSGGSDAGAAKNVCPGGPGKCVAGDSSTCSCGESCVETATGSGTYQCLKGCQADSDCTGYYSGDSPPKQLVCVDASSTMPTAHCGI